MEVDRADLPAIPLYFRVVAGNQVGLSPPSNTSKMVWDKCDADEYFMNQRREASHTWQCHSCPDGAECLGRPFYEVCPAPHGSAWLRMAPLATGAPLPSCGVAAPHPRRRCC